MLFDVQAALAEITGASPATLATKRQNVVEVADVAVGAREISAPATPPGGAVVLPRHDPAARPAPAPSALGSMVRLDWSGEWVSRDRWDAMTELERHGPRGGAGLPGREALPMRLHAGLKLVELAARRRAAGLTQRQLAEAAGVGRTAVQYWEAAPHLDPRGWAVRRMAEALGWAVWPANETTTHPRGDGVLSLASGRTPLPPPSLPPSRTARPGAPPAAASAAGPRPARARHAATRASRASAAASSMAGCPPARGRPRASSASGKPSGGAGQGRGTSQLPHRPAIRHLTRL